MVFWSGRVGGQSDWYQSASGKQALQEQSCGDKSMALEKRLGGGGRGRAGQALVSC